MHRCLIHYPSLASVAFFWRCVFLCSVCGVVDELSKCQCEPFPIESCDCVLSPVFISSGNIPRESFIFFWIQEMTEKKYCSGFS